MPVLFHPRAGSVGQGSDDPAAPLAFHRRLPGYTPTPLVELPELAAELALGRVVVKDESARLGLPAFKILGASWAVYRELADRLGDEPVWSGVEDLAASVEPLRPLELLAATDGNHGRAVARVARWLALGARIFVPQGTAGDRIRAIESEGARVIIVPGGYDEAVRRAAGERAARSLLIQDTGWPGYEEIPLRVIEGYATMFLESDRQMDRAGVGRPDLILVQIGVGALAAAVVRHYRTGPAGRGARIVGVEPEDAACAAASIERGGRVTVAGPHRSMMAGLNCGTLSSVAWPWIERGLDAVVTVGDDRAAEAMRRLAAAGVVSGESGAAGLAGLLECLLGPGSDEARSRLGVTGATRVLLLSTEGITDADNYRRVLGAGDGGAPPRRSRRLP